MANRFPLIANSSSNQIQELASGDNLDLTNSGINNVGNIYSVGVVTATSFYGDLDGNATYATTAGLSTDATKLQTPRTFEITGDVVASAISFDGSGNVSLAATIQPNSVGLGTDTEGEYVTNITGTANQIEVTGGTGEGSTPTLSVPSQFTAPQDVTVTRDLQVNRDLNVNGNITIGGTGATLFTTEFKVFDPDIVLGFRTDGSGNDISTDNTANHGGIAIASTEGTPLISLYDVGVGETNPATYKKIMWFKSGTFSGLGTDAWISNYAIGIGSTQVPNGVRLAAGSVKFTENDLSVVRNINATGVVTATSFSGSGSSLTDVPISTGISGLGANVATFLATPSSSNLASAVTGETGSGALVFANTPTLVTPDIGAATGTSLSVSGQLVSTQANSTTTGGGQIYLNGATGNRIDFNINGVAAPAFGTRSAGTKIALYPGLGASSADYALGIESSTLWSSVPTTSQQFKWYAGTTNVATLTGSGNLSLTGNLTSSSGTLGSNGTGNRTVQAGGSPSGGSDGDIYYIY
jgi:hypothetical protein